MATDKKTRLVFTNNELTELYAALGARAGMLRDMAAIRDLRPSEYVPQVNLITGLQDRIYAAVHSNGDDSKGELFESGKDKGDTAKGDAASSTGT